MAVTARRTARRDDRPAGDRSGVALACCGVTPGSYAEVSTWPDGGLRALRYNETVVAPDGRIYPASQFAAPEVVACLRTLVEPTLCVP
ncbi:MAG: hypothetical protein IPQ07_40135 [Myxococcales bacterium]|nr:hypothetical protein [Myxococcales bacterium]